MSPRCFAIGRLGCRAFAWWPFLLFPPTDQCPWRVWSIPERRAQSTSRRPAGHCVGNSNPRLKPLLSTACSTSTTLRHYHELEVARRPSASGFPAFRNPRHSAVRQAGPRRNTSPGGMPALLRAVRKQSATTHKHLSESARARAPSKFRDPAGVCGLLRKVLSRNYVLRWQVVRRGCRGLRPPGAARAAAARDSLSHSLGAQPAFLQAHPCRSLHVVD